MDYYHDVHKDNTDYIVKEPDCILKQDSLYVTWPYGYVAVKSQKSRLIP